MAHHAEALHPQAGGEAAVAVGIDAQPFQHGRIHHPAAHHLQPAAAPLHVHLGRGLGEGEIAGAEAHRQIPEELLQEGGHGAAQVAEIQALVDGQHLHLVKHRRVGGIHGIAAIHPAGGHDPHRWGVVLQMADLHRRGVGAQQLAVRQIEGVLHVPRRVVGRDVEGSEVVVVGLDLGALLHPVAQARKDVHDLLDRADQRVAMARRREAGGHGHVEGFGGDALGHGRRFHRLQALAQQALHLFLEHVGPLAHQGALVPWQLAHGPQYARELALLAQQAHPQLFQVGGGGGGGDRSGGLSFQLLELVGELLQADGGAHGWATATVDCRQQPRSVESAEHKPCGS